MTGRSIVLIVVDQLAARWLELALEGAVPLPNLADLSARGTTFHQAFTVSPVCTPARASLLTGLRPSVHGARDTGYRLDPAFPTVPRLLRDAGWRTGAFGKLHLAPQLAPEGVDAAAYGFETAEISEDSRAGAWIDWVRAEHPEHLPAALATVWMTDAAAITSDPQLLAEIEAAQAAHPEVTGRSYVSPLPAHVTQSAWIAGRAAGFIEQTPGERDLFAHVGFVQVHDPFSPPAEAVAAVDASRIPAPIPADRDQDRIPYYREVLAAAAPSADWRRERELYLADLAHLDAQVGRIVAALAEAGRRDALVVFTADHGDLLHDHGLVGKGERHYDGAIRVPFVVSGTRLPGVRDDLVDSTDLAPTLLDWAGVPAPTLPTWPGDDRIPALPGRSLLAGPTGRDGVLIESSTSDAEGSVRGWSRTLRTRRYRYTVHLAGGGRQLIDLEADPDETRDLARDPASRDLAEGLAHRLLEALAAESHPYPARGLYRAGSW